MAFFVKNTPFPDWHGRCTYLNRIAVSRQSKNIAPFPSHSEATPGYVDSLADLNNIAAITLGYVRELEAAARSIRENGFTAQSFESIASVGIQLGEIFQRHESLEEQHLFPELRKIDAGMVRSFTEEHRAVRLLFGSLLSLVRDIESGRIHGSSVGDLLRTIGEIVTLLRRHIVNEGDVLALLVRQKTNGMGAMSERKSNDTTGHLSKHQTDHIRNNHGSTEN